MSAPDELSKVISEVRVAIEAAFTLIQSLHSSRGGRWLTDAEVEEVSSQLQAAWLNVSSMERTFLP